MYIRPSHSWLAAAWVAHRGQYCTGHSLDTQNGLIPLCLSGFVVHTGKHTLNSFFCLVARTIEVFLAIIQVRNKASKGRLWRDRGPGGSRESISAKALGHAGITGAPYREYREQLPPNIPSMCMCLCSELALLQHPSIIVNV